MSFEENDIIVLDDNKQYLVTKIMEIENNKYTILFDLSDVSNIKYVKINPNDVDEIEDEESVKKIAASFASSINLEELLKQVEEFKKNNSNN